MGRSRRAKHRKWHTKLGAFSHPRWLSPFVTNCGWQWVKDCWARGQGRQSQASGGCQAQGARVHPGASFLVPQFTASSCQSTHSDLSASPRPPSRLSQSLEVPSQPSGLCSLFSSLAATTMVPHPGHLPLGWLQQPPRQSSDSGLSVSPHPVCAARQIFP